MTLIGQIFFISLVQTIVEVFLDTEKRSQQIRIINIACIMGSIYLLLQFVFGYILQEITSIVTMPF